MRVSSLLALVIVACGGTLAPPDAATDAAAISDASTCAPLCACPDAGVHELSFHGVPVSLHVPIAHRCDVASPLVVELAGTIDDGARAALDAQSDASAFVLVRLAASDADATLVEALVSSLGIVMPIDSHRLDVVGSGQGARLASHWLHGGALAPSGIGLIDYDAPASEAALPIRDFGDARPRVWLSTGFRSAGIDAQSALVTALAARGFDGYFVQIRERDTAEQSPAWLVPELWRWLDRASWPENGPPALPWARVMFPAPDASMLSLETMPDGTFRAGSADGRVLGTNASGKWSLLADLGRGPLLSIVARGGMPWIASTHGIVRSRDGLVFERDETARSAPAAMADREGVIFGLSSLGVVRTSDGASWTSVVDLARPSALAISPTTHTLLAVGRGDHYARVLANDVTSTTAIDDRLDDVAVGPDGTFWAVGSAATVLRSIDDGQTFTRVVDPEGRRLDDLYCVSIGDDGAMIAGGARGTIVVSHDGATLASWPTAGQGFIGAVRWLEPGRALILGELGLVAIGDGL